MIVRRETMAQWLRADRIKREVADVTDEWLRAFKVTHTRDMRKLGSGPNSRFLYRSEAVLQALEHETHTA